MLLASTDSLRPQQKVGEKPKKISSAVQQERREKTRKEENGFREQDVQSLSDVHQEQHVLPSDKANGFQTARKTKPSSPANGWEYKDKAEEGVDMRLTNLVWIPQTKNILYYGLLQEQ